MWLPLILLGVRPFRAALEEKLLLARYFHAEARSRGLRGGAGTGSLDRHLPLGAGRGGARAGQPINQRIVEGVRRDGRIFLSSTMLDGRFTLRMVALSFRTHRRTMDLAVRVLREQAAAAEAAVG